MNTRADTGIQFNQSFDFYADGQSYQFFISLSKPSDKAGEIDIDPVDSGSISFFEWTNEANKLCLTGRFQLLDTEGKFAKYVNSPLTRVDVKFERNENESSGRGDGEFNSTTTPKTEAAFEHRFFVEKVEIEDRKNNVFLYTFILKSISWFNLIAHIPFSNFGTPDPEKKPVKIFRIMKYILAKALENRCSVGESFDKIFNDSEGLELSNYITYANDTVFDSIRFLQSSMFTDDRKPKTISYITYDEFKNSYEAIDMDPESTTNPKTEIDANSSFISIHGSMLEDFLANAYSNFETIPNYEMSKYFMNLFGEKKYSFKNKTFDLPFDSSKKIECITKINYDAGLQNEKITRIWKDVFKDEIKYVREYSESHQNNLLMNEMMNAMRHNRIVKYESIGSLYHRPGMYFQIVSDNNELNNMEGNSADKSKKKQDMNDISGIYNILKTTHVIRPMQDQAAKDRRVSVTSYLIRVSDENKSE